MMIISILLAFGLIAYVIIIWLVFGFIASGFAYGYLQKEYSTIAKETRLGDKLFAIILGVIFGPLFLLMMLLLGKYKHGWKAIWT